MKVELINYTHGAVDLLLFTKETRLTLGKDTFEKIQAMSEEEKAEGLKYMSRTIPSSWEFCDYVFLITDVSRAFANQLVRTRQGSYAQQTLRMLINAAFTYVVPKSLVPLMMREQFGIYQRTMDKIREGYNDMIAMGVPAEDARGVLPLNIHTNLVAKFNLRTMSELARKRTGGRVQDEYREVLAAMHSAILDVHPWAEQFLFPRGRGVFDKVEAFIAKFRNQDTTLAVDALKDIDRARQEIG